MLKRKVIINERDLRAIWRINNRETDIHNDRARKNYINVRVNK